MKKALRACAIAAKILLFVFAILMLLVTFLSTTVNKEQASLLGYRFFIVRSDSMRPFFQAGDLTITKEVDTTLLNQGDVIAFRSIDPMNYGEVITHRILECTQYQGEDAFVTSGDATGIEDAYPVPAGRVLGLYQGIVPNAGFLFQFLKTPAGYCVLIFLPLFLLMVWQGARFFFLLRRSQKEQQENLRMQEELFAAKQLQVAQSLQELNILKKQLEKRIASPYIPRNRE